MPAARGGMRGPPARGNASGSRTTSPAGQGNATTRASTGTRSATRAAAAPPGQGNGSPGQQHARARTARQPADSGPDAQETSAPGRGPPAPAQASARPTSAARCPPARPMPLGATIRQAIPRRRGHAHYATSAAIVPRGAMLARGCPARSVEPQQHTASSTARQAGDRLVTLASTPRAPARGHRRADLLQQRAAHFSSAKKRSSKFLGRAAPRDLLLEDQFIRRERSAWSTARGHHAQGEGKARSTGGRGRGPLVLSHEHHATRPREARQPRRSARDSHEHGSPGQRRQVGT